MSNSDNIPRTSNGGIKMPWSAAMRTLSSSIASMFVAGGPLNHIKYTKTVAEVEGMITGVLSEHLDIDEESYTALTNLFSREEIEAIQRWKSGEPLGRSTGIHEGPTAGYGNLDSNGFWEIPLPLWIVEKIEQGSQSAMKFAIERPAIAKYLVSKRENNDKE